MKEASYCLLHPLIFMLGFVCILFFVAQQKRGDTNKQTVLFTGLSHPSLSTLIAFFRPLAERFRDIKEIVVFVDRNVEIRTTGMPDDTALKPTACWDYLFDATRNDEEKTWLEKRYRLSTEKLDECGISRDALAKLEDNDDFANKTEEERLASLKTFLETACTACLGDGVTVELLECDYSSDINTLINQIQDEIRKRIRPRGTHADEELLFHLTPGALSISVALAFNAAKGMRKSCYIEQDRKKLMTYNLENVE
jgi:hypothetical protein